MKTRFLNLALALFTVTALSSVARVGPSASQAIARQLSKPDSSAHTKHLLNDHCMADSCGGDNTVADGFSGECAAHATSKRVVTCDKFCSIAPVNQRSVCRNGMWA